MINDIFTNMNIPQLGDPNFQTNFQNFCSAIVENIQRLISVQYVKGEAGSSVVNRNYVIEYAMEPGDTPTFPSGPLCSLGQSMVMTLFDKNPIAGFGWTRDEVCDWVDGNPTVGEPGLAPKIGDNVVWPGLTRAYNPTDETVYKIVSDNHEMMEAVNDPENDITKYWVYDGGYYYTEPVITFDSDNEQYTISFDDYIVASGLVEDPTDSIVEHYDIIHYWEYDGLPYYSELHVVHENDNTYTIKIDGDTFPHAGDPSITVDPTEDITKFWTYTDRDSHTTESFPYSDMVVIVEAQGNKNRIEVSINIDEESHRAYLANPFILIDGRIPALSNLGNNEDSDYIRQSFIDFSTAIYGFGEYIANSGQDPNDPTTWTWTLHRVNIIPKIYYDDQIHEFCWNINGQNTGITAQGVTGNPGDSVQTWICLGTGADGGTPTNPTTLNLIGFLDEDVQGNVQWMDLNTARDLERPPRENDIAIVFWTPDESQIQKTFIAPIRGNTVLQVKYYHDLDIFDSYEWHNLWYKMWSIDRATGDNDPTDLPSPPRGYILPDAGTPLGQSIQVVQGVVASRVHMTWNYNEHDDEKGKLISSPIEADNWTQTKSGLERNTQVQCGQTGDWDINYNTNVQGNSCVQGDLYVQGKSLVDGTSQALVCGTPGVYLGVPIGTIMMWPLDIGYKFLTHEQVGFCSASNNDIFEMTDGWLLCNGVSIQGIDDFARLRSLLGGHTLPDFRQRFPLGAQGLGRIGKSSNPQGWATNIRNTGGEDVHTLLQGEMPRHDHGSAGDHQHNVNDFRILDLGEHQSSSPSLNDSALVLGRYVIRTNPLEYPTTTNAGAHKHTLQGNNESHNNIPPFYAINFIIKYK